MFLEKLDREHESIIDQIRGKHRDTVAITERQFLEHKHQLEQSMMSALWELEERQLKDRQNLNQQQFKVYFLIILYTLFCSSLSTMMTHVFFFLFSFY